MKNKVWLLVHTWQDGLQVEVFNSESKAIVWVQGIVGDYRDNGVILKNITEKVSGKYRTYYSNGNDITVSLEERKILK